MIYRKIDTFLDAYFEKLSRKALLLTGARQIGKTYSVREFAKRKFKHFVEINFIETPEAKKIFEGVANAKDILLRLSSYVNSPMKPGSTLIFLDEVQECPEAVTLIKFLVQEGSYKYVLSGSLLGVELKDLRSEPVGYMDVKTMYPIDMEEFALSLGTSVEVIENLRQCYNNRVQVDEFVHNRMMAMFRLYLVIGGMPAAVSRYLKTNNIKQVAAEHQAILNLYKRDIAKYDPQKKLYLNEIFDLIPSELNAKNKRFIMKSLNQNMKFSRYENSFLWLKDAGVALPTYNVEEPRMPLLLAKQRNLFKLFLCDTGLLTSQFGGGSYMQILQGDSTINFGSIYENVAAQELVAHGYNLYYFNSKKQGELDFVVEDGNGNVLPIEIKSGKSYERHNALFNVMNTNEYALSEAFVFCNDNVKTNEKVIYYPIYMLMFLQVPEVDDVVFSFDMTGLK